MAKKSIQIKDVQVKRNLRWHILRLTRLESLTREALAKKLAKIYLGYWPINDKLIDEALAQLKKENWVELS